MASVTYPAMHKQLRIVGTKIETLLRRSGVEATAEFRAAQEALRTREYLVAVIAPIKAGKSTFLNALMGADILPWENDACTAAVTHIRNRPEQTKITLSRVDKKHREQVIESTDPRDIRHRFTAEMHAIRSGEVNPPDRYEVELPIAAVAPYSEEFARFTLVDTPGSNENLGQLDGTQFKAMAHQCLRTANVILFIVDYTKVKDSANQELLERLREFRQPLIKASNRLFFVLNKVDQRTNRDQPLEETVASLERLLAEEGIDNPKVIPIAARAGMLLRLAQNSVHEREHEQLWDEHHAAHCMVDRRLPTLLEAAHTAWPHSGIPAVEKQIISIIFHNAAHDLMTDTAATFRNALKEVGNHLRMQRTALELPLQQLKESLQQTEAVFADASREIDSIKHEIRRGQHVQESALQEELDQFRRLTEQRIDETLRNFGARSHSLVTRAWKLVSKREEDLLTLETSDEQELKTMRMALGRALHPAIQQLWLDSQHTIYDKAHDLRNQLVGDIQGRMQPVADQVAELTGSAVRCRLDPPMIEIPGFTLEPIDVVVDEVNDTIEVKKTKFEEKRERILVKPGGVCSRAKYGWTVQEVPVEFVEHVAVRTFRLDFTAIAAQHLAAVEEETRATSQVMKRAVSTQTTRILDTASGQIKQFMTQIQRKQRQLLSEREKAENRSDQEGSRLDALLAEAVDLGGGLSGVEQTLRYARGGGAVAISAD